MYSYEDEEGAERSPLRAVIGVAAVVILAALAWFVVRPALDDDDDSAGVTPIAETLSSTGPAAGSTSTDVSTPSTLGSTSSASSAVDTTENAPVSTEGSTVDSAPPSTRTRSTSPPTTATDPAPTTTEREPRPRPSTTVGATYDTLPDGTPVPVIATFGAGTVRLQGAVPSRAASDRLAALAIANSRDPATVRLDNDLTINPAVPISVGVRVIELTSTRFPTGSSEVLFLHAIELDRVATVMEALPNVTVLVIGHADQRGSAAINQQLSEDRAAAVVDYLVGKGIDGSRLASRAVGESDLLTINNDDTALALNRRTEFIFYGLLLE